MHPWRYSKYYEEMIKKITVATNRVLENEVLVFHQTTSKPEKSTLIVMSSFDPPLHLSYPK